MKSLIQQFVRDEDGAAAIEYGLLAGLISIMIIAGATVIGTNLQSLFNYIGTKVPTGGA
ncbi:Flp family type IVb pilin [Trinickia terrae]|uniref:Flp family type IVb pilin n=1 Tax=Trinickia terrae TaxID=2571161 RepID=A0A4U1IFT0_9BURK|nr:Flp family type IVb pilin [Trinickia terrae]TKC92603.1 Flp family type IVb pilin [Trinickia terrae]